MLNIRYIAEGCLGAALIAVAGMALSCSGTDNSAGTGSQAGNARVAVLVNDRPAAGASVYIRIADAQADTGMVESAVPVMWVDELGLLNLDTLITYAPGSYLIEVVAEGCDTLAATLSATVLSANDVRFSADTLRLRATATLTGSVDTFGVLPGQRLWVQIPGIARTVPVDSTGRFCIPNVPAGQYPMFIVGPDTAHRLLPPDAILVGPGEAVDVGAIHQRDELWRDTMIVRKILDTNGVLTPVDSVVLKDTLGRIIELKLAGPQFTLLPPCIGALRIRALRINETSIEKLPMELGRIAGLRVLDLHANQLKGLPPELGMLIHLDTLDLSGNLIAAIPLEMTGILELRWLGVNNNKLMPPYPLALGAWINRFSYDPGWASTQTP